jgi:GDP-D-mannose dehydratase
MLTSILTSVKKNLGIDVSYTAFDEDIIMHINSAFSTLEQLGVGPEGGFAISDATAVWASFLGTDARLNSAKTYVYLSVRLLFDPPSTSYLITAMEKQKEELGWRLNVTREEVIYTDPDPDTVGPGSVLDGGDA